MITLAGSSVISGNITMPLRGPWTFEGKVDTLTVPSGRVTLSCDGGLSLQGTVDVARSGMVLGSARVRVVGGAGGMQKPVAGSFRSAQYGDVLSAIANQASEKLSSTIASSFTSLP